MVPRFPKTGRGTPAPETGAVRKSWSGRVSVALVYPNTYYVGMSNLGYQTVYRLINGFEDVVCERAFLPDRNNRKPRRIRSVESNQALADFDIIAFSISFENDYLHLLTILAEAGLPLFSSERCPPNPLIIAGGVTSLLNPEPLAQFVDCFLIGDAEAVLEPFFQCIRNNQDRETLLLELAQGVPGAYIPAFYTPTYDPDGTIASFRPRQSIPAQVKRATIKDLSSHDTFTAVLTPQTTFGNTCLVEGARGCPHGCRFCAAGFVYRPPRFRGSEQLEKIVQRASDDAQGVGLVAAAVADIPSLESLCAKVKACNLDLSFSSLRADMLTPSVLSTLKKSGTKTVTIAPDAGSERLRRVINKGITESDVLQAVDALVQAGILNIKLYFMVGLPTETMADVQDIVSLCKQVKHRFLLASKKQGRMGDIIVSVSSFVPKPFTPFQWVPMEDIAVLKKKINHIKGELRRVPNIKVHADVPRWAYIQALMSRGDRRVGLLLAEVHKSGGNWVKSLKESIVNPDFFVYRQRNFDETLPWDFIDHGLKKSFLVAEYVRAMKGETTAPCKVGPCKLCGVCD